MSQSSVTRVQEAEVPAVVQHVAKQVLMRIQCQCKVVSDRIKRIEYHFDKMRRLSHLSVLRIEMALHSDIVSLASQDIKTLQKMCSEGLSQSNDKE